MSRAFALLGPLLLLFGCGPSDEDIAKNLSSPNPVVREDTAKIARNFGSDPVNAALLTALQDPSKTVRLNAVESLAELGVVGAAPPLAELLPVEAEPEVQAAIIDTLGRLKDPVAVPALVAWLDGHPEQPPLNAVWALGNIGDSSALDVLSRLRESSDVYVRYNATAALRLLRP